jgi:hypothetical protein
MMPDGPTKKIVNRLSTPAAQATELKKNLGDLLHTPAGPGGPTPSGNVLLRPIDPGRIRDIIQQLQLPVRREFRVQARRPDDLAVFDVVFKNLKLSPQPGGDLAPQLEREDPSQPASLIVQLPAQSFGEQAYLDQTGPQGSGSPPRAFPEASSADPKNTATSKEPIPNLPASKIRMAGKSTLAFTMPASVTTLSLTLEAIMAAVRTWPERRDVLAAPDPTLLVVGSGGLAGKWLQAVVSSEDWATTAQAVVGSLQTATSPDVVQRVSQAAGRLSSQIAGAVGSGESAGTTDQLVQTEVDTILGDHPGAREGDTRSLVAAALSIKTTESLVSGRFNLGDDVAAVSRIPFLPIILSPHQPSSDVTALELPYRLIVSPIESARWTHRDKPVTDARSGRTELWHTRLTTASTDVGPDGESKIRAIWSPDFQIDPLPLLSPPLPYRMSLDPLDRKMLVQLMAGYDEIAAGTRRAYVPLAARTNRLMLSSLGALLDSEGNWSVRPAGVELEQWRHIATLGRDHYVRVVYAGFLCPFGHHASLIKVTERTFESQGGNLNHRVAVLRQQFYIVVREPVKTYANAGKAPGWFDYPLARVEILTRVTPSLAAPDLPVCMLPNAGNKIYGSVPPRVAFWPTLSASDLRFEIAATDVCGNRFTFAMPMLFVGGEANQNKVVLDEIIAEYNATPASPRRLAPIGGATVGFTPKQAGARGDPNLPATSITYIASFANRSIFDAKWDPHFETAQVGIRQIQRLLGQNTSVEVAYPEVYKASGFSASNPGEVFLKLTTPHDLSFGGGAEQAKSDALGALASPSMSIQGLSRIMGPVAAQPPTGGQTVEDTLKDVIGNKFDPTQFFKGAKILGGIDLSTVLEVAAALTGANVPKMVSLDLPDRVKASFDWQTEIKNSDPAHLLVPTADGKPTILSMNGRVSAPIGNPSAASFEANAGMTNFKVNLFGFIIIWFDALTFKASRGKKPDVAVDMHPSDSVVFGGPLEFVNELRNVIPSNGFSDPPSLQVTPSGIAASYSLSLPNIGVGIFALSNVSLGAGFSLPFDASPMEVRFNFSERQNPFSLTISLFGGGGFFAIGIGAEGVREIEAALEFGAAVAIDLGVASGGVEVKAGVYFHWLETGATKTVELAGYVRLHGELSVLGLISVSLTFNLQLAYLKQGTKSSVWGEATLTVEIEILFFSTSVSVQCRREFAGSPSDPTFAEFIPVPAVWTEYCSAFAAE